MQRYAVPTGLILVALMAGPFALYSLGFGLEGLGGRALDHRLFLPGATETNIAIFAHMTTGAVITVLAPVQLIPALRRRWPRWHRRLGYLLMLCAVPTAFGGLVFIGARGTIGGPVMNVGFALYGCLVALSVLQTVRFARVRDFEQHYAWAIRFFVLAIGSWLYRMHYAVWYAITDGYASAPDFSGVFDQVQVFAFYLPYLLLVELHLRRASARAT